MRTWLAGALFAALAGIGVGAAQAADMIALRYIEQDPGDPPYLTRIFVTPDFMRMDTGEDDGDFFLVDRRQRQGINVTRENKLAMVFRPGTLPPKPAGWAPRLTTQPGAPGTQRFSLTMKGVVCNEGVAAKAAVPDAARAMAEMKVILASMQHRVWQGSPTEMQHECDLVNQVWDTGTTLKLGLPLEERDFTGRTRQLESQSNEPLQPELFRLPEGVTSVNAPS